MGWKTDWLYKLIFKRVRDIWKRALREANTHNESAAVIAYPDRRMLPLERLLIRQLANGDTQKAHCFGPVKRI